MCCKLVSLVCGILLSNKSHLFSCKVADSSFCVELIGWRCIPLAVESYGAWGPEALRAFSQVAKGLAILGNTPTSKVVAELYGRLSLLLVRANA